MPPELAPVAALIRASRRLLFVTGAGLSADSGLPTYRGVAGLYNDANTEEGVPIEVALSGDMFRTRPDVVWRHIARVEAACRGAAPNRGHQVIAELERGGREVWVLTQNVDGLHRRAGSTRVIDIHGDISTLYCPHCAWREVVTDYRHLQVPPPCPSCAQIIRPDVVLFEELLDEDKVATLERELRRGFDVIFSVGTSSLFAYILEPLFVAHERGIPTVEINPGETDASELVTHRVRLGAAAALDALAALL
jgi:NAD-dependent deacetylase